MDDQDAETCSNECRPNHHEDADYEFDDIVRKPMKRIRGISVAGGKQLSQTRVLKWICAENNVHIIVIGEYYEN